jgi:hypothetical protein
VLLALVAGGAFATRAAEHLSPLQFRIVIVAHAGTLPPQSMSLIVTRRSSRRSWPCLDHRVRSRSIRVAISAQFAPSTDMIVALQTVQNCVSEITGELPAGTPQVERMTPRSFRCSSSA